MAKLSYKELIAIENSLTHSVIDKIKKGLGKVFEGKKVEFVGTDFDKNIYFYVNSAAKAAKWSINENQISFSDISDVELSTDSFKAEFNETLIEAINKLSEEKLHESDELFSKAIDLVCREATTEKLKLFKPSKNIKESKKVVALKKEVKKEPTITNLVESLKKTIYKLIGTPRTVKNDTITVNLTEGKVNQAEDKVIYDMPLLRKVMLAKEAAMSLDVKPVFENAEKFIGEHEELFLLKSDVFKSKLQEAAKDDIAITDSSINEAFESFIQMRQESEDLKKIFEDELPGEITDTEKEETEEKKDDKLGIDSDIESMDKKYDEEKLGFMNAFVEIIVKIFDKVKELSNDNDIKARADRAVEMIKKQVEQSEEDKKGWDKEKLEELAKEAIELAASVEGIQPAEKDVAEKQVDKAEDEQNKEEAATEDRAEVEVAKESVDQDQDLLLDMPSDDADNVTDMGEPMPGLEDCHCFSCEKEFGIETGTDKIHCPYCQAEISVEFENELPVEEPLEAPEKEEVAIGNVQPQKDEVAILNVQPQESIKRKGKLVKEMDDKPSRVEQSEDPINEEGKEGASVKYKKVGSAGLESKIDDKNQTPSKAAPNLKDTDSDEAPASETEINDDGKVGAGTPAAKVEGDKKLESAEDTKSSIPSKAAPNLKDTEDDELDKSEKEISEAEAKAPVKMEITDDDFAGKGDEEDIYAEEPIDGEEAPVDMPVEEPAGDVAPEMPVEEPVEGPADLAATEGGDVVSMVKDWVLDAIKDQITVDELRKYTEDHLSHYMEANPGAVAEEGKEEIINQILDAVVSEMEEVTDEVASELGAPVGEETPAEVEAGAEEVGETPAHEELETPEHEASETPEEEAAEEAGERTDDADIEKI